MYDYSYKVVYKFFNLRLYWLKDVKYIYFDYKVNKKFFSL